MAYTPQNCRIVQTADYPALLLYRDVHTIDDYDIDVVVIQAYGQKDDDPYYMYYDTVKFSDPEMCQAFIRDFSIASAEQFYKDLDITFPEDEA